MVLGAPQIIYLITLVLGLGISLAQHGTKRTGMNSFPQTLFAATIQVLLMYWGGFFS